MPKVVKGVSFLLRLTVAADDGSERLVSTARTTECIPLHATGAGRYMLTVRAVNAWAAGRSGNRIVRIAATAVLFRIQLTPGYFR
ncbi:hypothetical protein ACLB1N_33015 [Escherichia coli]